VSGRATRPGAKPHEAKKAARAKEARAGKTKKKASNSKASNPKASNPKASKGKAPKKKSVTRKAAKKAPTRKAAKKKAATRSKGVRAGVYFFGAGRADGRASMKDLLGGKGANLAEMTRLGVPVPPGFTISTEVCADFVKRHRLSRPVRGEVLAALARVEEVMGNRLGDVDNPLLVSVRSGARVSMPGMMDTVLNLGLNDESVLGLARQVDERFAFDSYRRFIQMYSDVVLGVRLEHFETRMDAAKRACGAVLDTDLKPEDLRGIASDYLEIVLEETGKPFPQDPYDQLWGAISAVFRSWSNDRAKAYRRLNEIPEDWGTAVNVQAMVFGNMGDDCATGVAFTRDPSSGERKFFGEYLKNAQGEDVVAGVRTPQPINEVSRSNDTRDAPTLEGEMPRAYRELVRIYKRLEKHYRDMQDIEFTIQRGVLWMLQTRSGKRTARAGVRIAVEMAKERLISRDEALLRVEATQLDQLLHPAIDPDAERDVIARGLPASPGAAVGCVVFSAEQAEARDRAGEKVVLVRIETSPEDIVGMHVSQGILTARGGMTSHAAVVARGMGKSCVAGCGALQIDYARRELRIGSHVIREGDPLTIDGSSGEVMLGSVPTVTPELGGAFSELLGWADRRRKLRVRANADTPEDAAVARGFGAEGIGLCRTEHMFFEPNRILVVRQMILANGLAEREAALAKLLPMQRGDFVGIFRAMEGLAVTIRLLDPPLHEFLPHDDEDLAELAEATGMAVAEVRAKAESLREYNPMLGHRGCRLGVTYPEIYRMQVRAICEAACEVLREGRSVQPEVMIPLVANDGELSMLRAEAEATIESVRQENPDMARKLRPHVGTMIEVPRACLTADVIAEHADFFSFGTNDLTQMGYALSRDDAGRFLPRYVENGILDADPFVSIDEAGIGELVRLGATKGRATRPRLQLGVCGEHGGDPRSVLFFASIGLDYVSCSPFRVPLARLAAAQAVLQPERRGAR